MTDTANGNAANGNAANGNAAELPAPTPELPPGSKKQSIFMELGGGDCEMPEPVKTPAELSPLSELAGEPVLKPSSNVKQTGK